MNAERLVSQQYILEYNPTKLNGVYLMFLNDSERILDNSYKIVAWIKWDGVGNEMGMNLHPKKRQDVVVRCLHLTIK